MNGTGQYYSGRGGKSRGVGNGRFNGSKPTPNMGMRGGPLYPSYGGGQSLTGSRAPLNDRDYRTNGNYSLNPNQSYGNGTNLNQGFRDPYYGPPAVNRIRRFTPAMPSQPSYQQRGHYYSSPRDNYEDYDSYDQPPSWFPHNRPQMGGAFGPMDHGMEMSRKPWLSRNQMVLGYLGLHNLRQGKTGLYTIKQLNYLMRSKLHYVGPPVVYNARLNDNNIEVVFPSMDLLRAVVEKLSPITMKGDLTIYVTYKPPMNAAANFGGNFLNGGPALFRPRPGPMRKPLSHLVSRVRRGPTPVSGKMALSPSKAQQLRKNKQNLPRLRGVFPDGVQPRQVTLVVDTSSPFTSLASLKGSGHQLIVGNNLDMAAFLSLIRGNFSTDGVLYVVMPSLALLLNNLDAFSMNTSSEDETVDQPEQNGGPAIQQNGTDQQNGSAQQNGVAQKPVQANNKAGRSKKRSLLQEVLTDFLPLISALDVEFLGKPVASSGKTVPDDRSALARLLARHLLHSAVALRASVRASTNNCELVFCGYPVHHLDQGRLEAALSTTLSPPRAQRVASALVFALRVFNDFAVNSWMLGGFKINRFNDANLPDPSSAPAVATEDQTPVGQSVEAVAGLLESLTVDQQQQPGAVISLSSLASLDWFDEAADKEAVRTGYTANVLTAVQKVCNFQLHKGGFVPWGPVEAEPIEDDFVPDIVEESVKCKIYTEQVDAATNKTLYHCNECSQLLGDIAAADSHAYTRRHSFKARRNVLLKAKEGGPKKSVLMGTLQPTKAVTLAKDYVTKMINFKVVSKTETSLGNSYQCLVCEISRDNSFDDTALRFHVHHYRHRLNVINLFGLKSHRAMVSQHENWQLVQSLLRHPSLDVVVLADDRHRSTLQRISAANDQVHLVTLPELLQAEQSASIAASALAEGQRATEGRPALWFIVSGADLLCRADQNQDAAENVEKLVSPVLSLLASLRALLPVSQRVVLAPLLPLYLLSDSLPHASTAQLLANTNALTAPQPQLPAFAILYRALHKRLQALHAATALQANVPAVHANVLRRDPVISVTNASGVPCLVATPWHVALQPLVTAATVALPSLYLMPSCEPLVDELELDARVQHVALVGENIHVKKATRFDSNKQLVFERKLCFDQDDIDFISAKAELCEEGCFTVWYLACPLPATLFDRSDSNCCQAAQCSSPLSSFSPRGEGSVSEALLKISKFVTKLQSVLPSGNIVSLMPVFPSSVVSYSSTDAVTHAALHSLSQSLPSMSFSQESPQALNKVLASFRDGWTDLFSKTSLHYKMRGDRNHLVQAQALEINAAVSDLKEEMKGQAQDWLASVNALLRNHSNRLMVCLVDSVVQQLNITSSEDKQEGEAITAEASDAPVNKQE